MIELHNGIMFDFYLGLPHLYLKHERNMLIIKESPDKLVQSNSDRTEFSNGVREKVAVSTDSRVAFQETLGEVVDKNAQRMIR